MSHASLVNADTGDTGAWKRDSRLSLSGTSDVALDFFLNKQNSVRALVFCLDNDTVGRAAAATMAREYAHKGYTVLNKPPRGKDFNEDLQAHRAAAQAEKRANKQQRTERRGLYERD
jgi:DNA primase